MFETMSTTGLIFMFAAWAFVIGLMSWCIVRVLKTGTKLDEVEG